MIYVNHRINTIRQLGDIPLQNGVEIDIRYHENELILHHDPFMHHENNPCKLKDFIQKWAHNAPIILNIKTEGIEQECIALMNKYKIKKWFFLDLSMPFFVSYANYAIENRIKGFSKENLAVRFSEYEPIEYALSFKGKASWVWVDCFNNLALDNATYKKLIDASFNICIVSPELQKHSMKRIQEFRTMLKDKDISLVCTKRPDLWGQSLEPDIIKQLENEYSFK